MDRREHHRAQLRLPVRIRWNTPFGQKTELCKTLDISRGGLLVPCQETHTPGVPLWVTFPYDSSMPDSQPEMLAKVVCIRPSADGNGKNPARAVPGERALALHFTAPFRSELNGNGHAKTRERRKSPRRPLAIPVRVRPPHIPWFEEAMTIDISAHGLRFLSSREYHQAERLLVSFEPTVSTPWPSVSETAAQVLHIERVPDSAALAVTISREG